MEVLKGPFAEALRRGRAGFNARIADALSVPAFDAEAFLRSLREDAAPLVDAAEAAVRGSGAAVAEEVFALFLRAARRGQAPDPAVVSLLACAPALLAARPGLAASLERAVSVMSGLGLDARAWASALAALAPSAREPEAWLEAGKVLAWRSGAAHWRAGALAAAGGLDPRLAAGALGMGAAGRAEVGEALEALAEDLWLDPARPSAKRRFRIVHRLGAFRGFGGPFLRPPSVVLDEAGFLLGDGEACWRAHADLFGAVLTPDSGTGAGAGTAEAVFPGARGRVRWNGSDYEDPALAPCRQAAWNAVLFLASSPASHRVVVAAVAP